MPDEEDLEALLDRTRATRFYPESRRNGLMICGIEWGHSKHEVDNGDERKTFFSDGSVPTGHPYRPRLIEWFKLFGHPLREDCGSVKEDCNKRCQFECSIIQTNWLTGDAHDIGKRNIIQECIDARGQFFRRLEALQPRLIIFVSVNLLRALNAPQCLPEAQRILGVPLQKEPDIHQLDIPPLPNGKAFKKFNFGFQRFERTQVLALLHPASRGLASEYVRAFASEVGPHIQRFKDAMEFDAP